MNDGVLSGEDVSLHFPNHKEENQTEFVIPLPSVEATFAEPGTLFILFTQYSTGAA